MSAIRVPSGMASPSSPTGPIPGARESKLSRYFLLWLPIVTFVGFTLAETVFALGPRGIGNSGRLPSWGAADGSGGGRLPDGADLAERGRR